MHVGGHSHISMLEGYPIPTLPLLTQLNSKTPAQLKNQSSTAHYNKPQTTSTQRPRISFPSPSPSLYHHRQSTSSPMETGRDEDEEVEG